jgi:hypothetical protein
LREVGCHPLTVPMGWMLPDGLPTFRDKIALNETDVIRNPSAAEEELLEWGLQCASAFGMDTDVGVKIFESEKAIQGLGDMSGFVLLREDTFKDKKSLLQVLFHELGHVESKAGDYDRRFSDYFISKMVGFVLE